MPLIPSSPCPNCGRVLDGATGVNEANVPDDAMMPAPGDVTVCIRCGHLCAFDEELRLRHPTEAELQEVAGDRRLLAISRAIAGSMDPDV